MSAGPLPLPRVARALIAWLIPESWRDSVEGDLLEERARRLGHGRRGGLLWMARDTVLTGIRLRLARRRERRLEPRRQGRGVLDAAGSDLAQAWRRLRASPVQALAAILTLALGIGASAAVFNLANWLLLRPLPGVRDPAGVVTVRLSFGLGHYVISVRDAAALASGAPGLADLAGHQSVPVHFAVDDGEARRMDSEAVTGSYFDVLGRPLALGRAFTATEGLDPALPPVAVASDRLWRRDLGASRDAIGRTVIVNRQPVRIIGVASPGFHGTTLTSRTDLWMTIAQHRLVLPAYGDAALTNRSVGLFFDLVGRLAPGATPEIVAAQMEVVRTQILAASPTDRRTSRARFTVTPLLDANRAARSRLREALAILMGIVVLVLVLTAANVGNLLVAQAVTRRAEIATRLALGASRLQVARLLLVESLLLSALACLAAIGVAWIAAAALEGTVVLQGLPAIDRAEIDWRVVGFALTAATAVAIGVGVFPAFTGGRMEVASALRRTSRTQTARRRLARGLAAAQVAVAITLAVGTGLLVRSIAARLAIDTGFDASRVLTFAVDPSLQGYGTRLRPIFGELLARVREVPGVRAAAMAWLRPTFQNIGSDVSFRAEGAPESSPAISSDSNPVSPDFFDAVGLPLVAGRTFTESEFRARPDDATGVVILTESLARRTFGAAPAVGSRIVMSYPKGALRTVVGVVKDTRQQRLLAEAPDMLFTPIYEGQTGWATIVVGLAGPEEAVIPGLRRAVRAVDPTLPMYDVLRIDRAIRLQFAEELLVTRLAVVFSTLALIVGAVGLYGVLVRGLSERRRELGIRTALGASPASVASLIAREAALMLAVGAAMGIGASLWLARFLDGHLFGVARFDTAAFGAALGVVTIVMAAATAPVGRRAARTDPSALLRE
jgi:putative ABC transport system permease protein